MSHLGKTVLVKVGEKEVVCRELTVSAVRHLIETPPANDLITDALFDDVRLADLVTLTSLEAAEIEAMLPSDLRAVVDGCKKANPDFFDLLARLAKVQKPA